MRGARPASGRQQGPHACPGCVVPAHWPQHSSDQGRDATMSPLARFATRARRSAAIALLALSGLVALAGPNATFATTDSCGYPTGSGRSATTFNESTVLK